MDQSSSDGRSLPAPGGTGRPNRSASAVAVRAAVVAARWGCGLALLAVRPVAFWGAVILPLVYLPALYGVGAVGYRPLLLELLALHAASILLGHGHSPFWSRS